MPRKKIERFELDIEIENIKGEKVPYWLTITPLIGLVRETIGIVEQFKDITERKHYEAELMKANSELERLATMDGLTQLANRRCFDDTIKKEWRRARREIQPLSVILCDVDYFKLYNDHYGHQEGDECLKMVAKCLQTSLLRSADFIARYGGEEFVIILPNTDSAGA
jgi:PleD family two-component response regulator